MYSRLHWFWWEICFHFYLFPLASFKISSSSVDWNNFMMACLDVDFHTFPVFVVHWAYCIYVCCCCSVAKSCPTLSAPVTCSTPSFLVLYYFLEFAQIHVHWVSDAIQPSHPLLSLLLLPSIFPSIRVFSNESVLPHQVAKVLEFQL